MIIYTPLLDGIPVFGDPSQFSSAQFGGPPANEDTFLGLTPGTTRYAPAANGAAWAVAGVLVGPTPAAVSAAQAQLQACAGLEPVAFARPTGLQFPGDYEVRQSCYFEPGELVFSPGGIVEITSSSYSIGYKLVLHQVGDNVTPS